MRGLLVVVVLVGCRETSVTSEPVVVATVEPQAHPPPSVASSTSPRPIETTSADPANDAGHAAATFETAGDGTCKRDSDCELTTYQEGCCVQGCTPYAMSKADLATARRKEDCARNAPKRCPPPAPCPPATSRAKQAVCRRGKCTAVYERL